MRRRDFVTALSGAAAGAAVPVGAQAAESEGAEIARFLEDSRTMDGKLDLFDLRKGIPFPVELQYWPLPDRMWVEIERVLCTQGNRRREEQIRDEGMEIMRTWSGYADAMARMRTLCTRWRSEAAERLRASKPPWPYESAGRDVIWQRYTHQIVNAYEEWCAVHPL